MKQVNEPRRDWVTSAELAEMAGVSVRTVLREVARGNLAASKHVTWIIARPDAEAWLTSFRKYDGLFGGGTG